ncbi:hypothetical protein GOB57_24125 [Sinorhizobium meliloti]|nr:hypothetical protein [Sinorhizobium meliloti]
MRRIGWTLIAAGLAGIASPLLFPLLGMAIMFGGAPFLFELIGPHGKTVTMLSFLPLVFAHVFVAVAFFSAGSGCSF